MSPANITDSCPKFRKNTIEGNANKPTSLASAASSNFTIGIPVMRTFVSMQNEAGKYEW